MSIVQPLATDNLDSPSHSLQHRIFAADPLAPTQSLTVDSSGIAGGGIVGTGANQLVQLNSSAQLPAVDGSQLTNLPTQGGVLGDGTVNPANLVIDGNFKSWSLGASATPDSWSLAGSGASVAQEGTIKKLGTYSVKLTRSGYDMLLFQSIQADKGINYWKGRIINYSCWVYATVANRARIYIGDGVGDNFSSYHTGNSTWQLLTMTYVVNASATTIDTALRIDTGDTSAYFDGAMCVEGASAFAFSDKPTTSVGLTGGTGSAGAGKQYVSLTINGTTYKILHDGTI